MTLKTREALQEIGLSRGRFLEIVRNFSKGKVLVIGDFILDQFIWGQVNRISPEAPVPVVRVDRESYMLGGALNVANNIVMLKGQVFPSGVVGRDVLGRMLVKVMKTHGVDASGVTYDRSRPTTQKTRIIAHSQQVVRFDRELVKDIDARDEKKILKYVQRRIREVSGVIIEDYGKGVATPALIRGIIRIAKKNRKFVLVDPKEKNFPHYKGVSVITPNRKEAYGGLGLVNADGLTIEQVGARLLKKLNCQSVLVTLGEEGMALFEKGKKMFRISTAAREIFDVSGAGDTVVATFSLALASGANMREAAFIANLAAGVVVGKLGTATATQEELIESFTKEIAR